ncbi:MAG: hypothetical protein R3331_02090 [Sulfurospirillaceae bacterium]|nr:hypothetical protein [Sulfurospirillaceae bacterium]
MSWLSSLLGGGGSTSSTTSNTTVSVSPTTIINTDKLAQAIADGNATQAQLAQATITAQVAEQNAKLQQNAQIFDTLRAGAKKYAFLSLLGFGVYKIFKNKRGKK